MRQISQLLFGSWPIDAYPMIAGLFDAYSILEIGPYNASSVVGAK